MDDSREYRHVGLYINDNLELSFEVMKLKFEEDTDTWTHSSIVHVVTAVYPCGKHWISMNVRTKEDAKVVMRTLRKVYLADWQAKNGYRIEKMRMFWLDTNQEIK